LKMAFIELFCCINDCLGILFCLFIKVYKFFTPFNG
jgi:hypothetical protein